MKRPFLIFAIILSILILIFRFFVRDDILYPGHISNFISNTPRHLAIKGTIVNDPFQRRAYFKKAEIFIVSPELVKISKRWFAAYGNIRVTSHSDKELKYGDEILFEAKLKSPSNREEDSFDYKRYLEKSGIYALAAISDKHPVIVTGKKAFPPKSLAYNLKDVLKDNIRYLFGAPERYFLYAVLLGERQDIPEEWKDIFIKTQTMHLLAISGLHVGIIAFIIFFLVGVFRVPRNYRYIVTILLLIFYAVMVGARPSVVRATVMGVLVLGSFLLKRDADIYNSLGLAAAAILIFNPDQLFNTGFILSFVSVISIVYMTPRITRAIGIDKIRRNGPSGRIMYYFSTLASASFAVWLGLLPLTANFFGIISPISVFVNILAIPLLFVIIAFSITALILRPILLFLGVIFAEAVEFFIGTLLSTLRTFSKLPMAFFEVESPNIFLIILYYIFLGVIFKGKKLTQYPPRGPN
jgi:competence protein ComEC